MMKLRAQIIIDIDAENYPEAAEHQRQLEAILENVKSLYEAAELQIRERRERRAYRSSETPLAASDIHVMKRRK